MTGVPAPLVLSQIPEPFANTKSKSTSAFAAVEEKVVAPGYPQISTIFHSMVFPVYEMKQTSCFKKTFLSNYDGSFYKYGVNIFSCNETFIK